MTRPIHGIGGNPQRQPVPVDLRIGIPEVKVPWNHAAVHREHHLHQPGDPGRGLQVADVGLHRTDQQRALRLAPPAVDRPGRLRLDRVPDLGAGAVRLQVVHFRGQDSCLRQRLFDAPLLRRAVGNRQSRARAVLVDRRAPDHGPDAVAVRLRVAQPLQHHDPAALAPHVPVRGGVERLALSVRRQHSGIAAQFREPSRQDRVHPSGEGKGGLAPLQARYRLVYRHQR